MAEGVHASAVHQARLLEFGEGVTQSDQPLVQAAAGT